MAAGDAADTIDAASFRRKLLRWFARHGRKNLPWQQPPTPYRVWVSEIMLQQTQVATVIPYFEKFMARFPDMRALTQAADDEVMAHWAGLGYYARARNLHRCAKIVTREYGGALPDSLPALMKLPGIGRSTAGAIIAHAFGGRGVILDGNVRRVLSRYAAIAGWPGSAQVAAQLWALAEQLTPRRGAAEHGQAMMDLGAMVCLPARPRCPQCPLSGDGADGCRARVAAAVHKYPGKKPAKALPEKAIRMLVCEADGMVLLEKRPPVGVWGGLWSLPEMDAAAPAETIAPYIKRRYGIAVRAAAAGEPFKHTFTHFRLQIEPWFVRARHSDGVGDGVVMENTGAWVKRCRLSRYGMPRPVQRLLARRFSAQNTPPPTMDV